MSALLSATCARLLLLERQLRDGGIPVASKGEVSVPTFKRDLSMLRSELGAVIVFDRMENRYILRNTDWPGVMPHVLDEAERAAA